MKTELSLDFYLKTGHLNRFTPGLPSLSFISLFRFTMTAFPAACMTVPIEAIGVVVCLVKMQPHPECGHGSGAD